MLKKQFILVTCLLFSYILQAQNDGFRRLQGASRLGSGATQGQGDSLKHRTGLEDSITIRFRYLDSTSLQGFDSSVTDFTKRFPIPWHHVHLGNFGTATQSLLFSPIFQSGWDHGFHSFDVYNFSVPQTRFLTTTRPYSEIAYLLGSQSEQMIQLLHTQNIRPNWNASIQYRLINAPGFAPAWEMAKSQALSQIETEEKGMSFPQKIFRKLMGPVSNGATALPETSISQSKSGSAETATTTTAA